MIASVMGMAIAAPTPWIPLAPISIAPLPAIAASRLATRKTAMPAANSQ